MLRSYEILRPQNSQNPTTTPFASVPFLSKLLVYQYIPWVVVLCETFRKRGQISTNTLVGLDFIPALLQARRQR